MSNPRLLVAGSLDWHGHAPCSYSGRNNGLLQKAGKLGQDPFCFSLSALGFAKSKSHRFYWSPKPGKLSNSHPVLLASKREASYLNSSSSEGLSWIELSTKLQFAHSLETSGKCPCKSLRNPPHKSVPWDVLSQPSFTVPKQVAQTGIRIQVLPIFLYHMLREKAFFLSFIWGRLGWTGTQQHIL